MDLTRRPSRTRRRKTSVAPLDRPAGRTVEMRSAARSRRPGPSRLFRAQLPCPLPPGPV